MVGEEEETKAKVIEKSAVESMGAVFVVFGSEKAGGDGAGHYPCIVPLALGCCYWYY